MTSFNLVLLLLVLLLPLVACQRTFGKSPQSSSADLVVLDERGLYQPPDIPWSSSIQEVESILGKTLELHPATQAMITNPLTQEVVGNVQDLKDVILTCEDAWVRDGRSAWAKLTFTDGSHRLRAIEYFFESPEEDLPGLFDSLNAALLKQFGHPTATGDQEVPWTMEESPPDTVIARYAGNSWVCRVADDMTVVGVDKRFDADDRVVQVVLCYQLDESK